MSVEATTAAAAAVAGQSTVKTQTQKSSSESFKDELTKVSDKDSDKFAEAENTEKATKNEKAEKNKSSENAKSEDKSSVKKVEDNAINMDNSIVNSEVALKDIKENALSNINCNLTDNIYQMMSTNIQSQGFWSLSLGENDSLSPLSMTENDAEFFINLTKNESVNISAITSQAQAMIDQGADVNQIKKNSQVSQTLLQALSNAREKNQPVRIDFDRNISVILRVGQNGAIAAHFIPGDKAVEQYLRNNIESLKNTFNENDIPYSDLSYSHSSKDQNQRRRNENQGE